MKRVRVRYIFVGDSGQHDDVLIELRDDETVVGADHEGSMWWVYVAREVDIPDPRPPIDYDNDDGCPNDEP